MKTTAVITLIILAIPQAFLVQDPPAQKPSDPMVALRLIVTDKNGKSVKTLLKDEVRVIENNVEQTILSVDADERPVDLGLIIDATGSFRLFIESSLEAARLIIANRRPADEIFIERFVSSDNIHLFHDFTKDGNALNERLKLITIEGGQSAVIDALYAGAQYVAKRNSGGGRRKALVIITDGEDRYSANTIQVLTKFLREQDVQVFMLGIVWDLNDEDGLVRKSPRARAEKLLQTVAEESGGHVFFLRDKKKDLLEATAQLIDNLHGQSRITYQSSNAGAEKGFRKVDVKFDSKGGEKRTLIVPKGYYTGSNDVQVKPKEQKSQ